MIQNGNDLQRALQLFIASQKTIVEAILSLMKAKLPSEEIDNVIAPLRTYSNGLEAEIDAYLATEAQTCQKH